MYIAVTFIFLLLLILIIIVKLSNLKEINKNLITCENKIIDILRRKENLTSKVVNLIENDKLKDKLNFDNNIDIFLKEQLLFDINWEINKFCKEDIKFDIENDIKIINDIEDEIEGLKDFYNAYANRYNEKYLKKPFHFIYKLFKFNNKNLFKSRRLDEYEILKN